PTSHVNGGYTKTSPSLTTQKIGTAHAVHHTAAWFLTFPTARFSVCTIRGPFRPAGCASSCIHPHTSTLTICATSAAASPPHPARIGATTSGAIVKYVIERSSKGARHSSTENFRPGAPSIG